MEEEPYIPDVPITMKESTSLFPNNLSVWGHSGTLHYVVTSRGLVNIVVAKTGGTMQKQMQGKECSHAKPIIQAKFVALSGNLYLILCTFHGIQIHNATDQRLLLFHPLPADPSKPGEEVFAQGAISIGNDMVAVGASSGRILIFKKDSGTFAWADTLQATFSGHSNPICDIQYNGKRLFTSDDNGCILVWCRKSDTWDLLKTFEGAGSPCSTMCVYNDYVVGGYGSGHIRVFNHQDGSLVAEITAHARWINALDVNPSGLMVSVSEDTIVNLWNLKDISLQHSFSIPNVQLCGAQFLQGSDDFAVTGYDMKDILIFKKNPDFKK
ncbi:hypothetical protein ACHWQZ_G008232 [Mnemiopsis leidyi]